MTLRENIRRALTRPCTTDILRHFTLPAASGAQLSSALRMELVRRNWSVSDLAARINRPRNSVSLVIHQRRKIPSVEDAVRKELCV